VASGEQEPAVL